MSLNETFSIIMPAHNAEATIEYSINSVLSQTDQDFQLIIVNDASTDNTQKIIDKYNDERIIKLVNKVNLGVAETRNRALNIATGRYIAFLDSDDAWKINKLERQRREFNNGHLLVCSAYCIMDKNGTVNNKKIFFKENIEYKDMLKSNFIANLTGCYDSQILGKFYQKKIGHEDYAMWLDIISVAKVAYCIPECLAVYRIANHSVSSNKIRAMYWQFNIYRQYLKMNIVKAVYYFIHYAINALKKR
ncbi:glycosyltransferase [Escherichia albertii]|uniref:Predicted glycosyltransferase family 2 n=1 Tax=Escherichia albertii TaxID=208962 RepID=A0A5A4U9S9_ESCAL|nr:glycosyltransferase [Escherichia albertii]BBM62783.1 predicted glycosyltransferase family 2 [Escherichia albertii]